MLDILLLALTLILYMLNGSYILYHFSVLKIKFVSFSIFCIVELLIVLLSVAVSHRTGHVYLAFTAFQKQRF